MTEARTSRLAAVLNRPSTRFNLSAPQLVEAALRRGEGRLSSTGAFSTTTGKYTGRSPNDKFIVEDEVTRDTVAWGKVNVPFSEEKFHKIYDLVLDFLEQRDELFVFDGYVGAPRSQYASAGDQPVRLAESLCPSAVYPSAPGSPSGP